jgi:hypothetical protein
MQRLVLVLAACLLGAMPLAHAEDADPADLAFWQSIQNSTNPAEYQAYLQAFPNGKFAALARIRVTTPPAAAAAAAPAAPAAANAAAAATAALQQAAPAAGGDVGQGEKIVIKPASLRVGQTAKVTCTDYPNPTSYDKLVVVPAGSPNVDPDSPTGSGIQVLWFTYASNCNKYDMTIGPCAPGQYEIRFMTRLYNNDGRQEISTRTPFTVR